MIKIRSKKDEEKSKRKKQIVLGVVLVFVMLFSVLGYGFQSQTNNGSSSSSGSGTSQNYNGLILTQQNGLWTTQISDIVFGFANFPDNLYSIDSRVNSLNTYSGKPLYFFSENYGAEQEITRNLQPIVLRMQRACLSEEECEGDVPLKTCSDNFIIIKESNETSIVQNQSCVFINAPSNEIVKATDEFLFKSMGIK